MKSVVRGSEVADAVAAAKIWRECEAARTKADSVEARKDLMVKCSVGVGGWKKGTRIKPMVTNRNTGHAMGTRNRNSQAALENFYSCAWLGELGLLLLGKGVGMVVMEPERML